MQEYIAENKNFTQIVISPEATINQYLNQTFPDVIDYSTHPNYSDLFKKILFKIKLGRCQSLLNIC